MCRDILLLVFRQRPMNLWKSGDCIYMQTAISSFFILQEALLLSIFFAVP